MSLIKSRHARGSLPSLLVASLLLVANLACATPVIGGSPVAGNNYSNGNGNGNGNGNANGNGNGNSYSYGKGNGGSSRQLTPYGSTTSLNSTSRFGAPPEPQTFILGDTGLTLLITNMEPALFTHSDQLLFQTYLGLAINAAQVKAEGSAALKYIPLMDPATLLNGWTFKSHGFDQFFINVQNAPPNPNNPDQPLQRVTYAALYEVLRGLSAYFFPASGALQAHAIDFQILQNQPSSEQPVWIGSGKVKEFEPLAWG